MKVLSHRGYHAEAGIHENTHAAFERAIEFGVDGIETDIRLSADGQPMNQEGSIVWDGAAHKVDNPDGSSMMVAAKKIGERVLDVTVKQNDKVVQNVKVSVSADGKLLTVALKGKDPMGHKLDNTEVFEKQ